MGASMENLKFIHNGVYELNNKAGPAILFYNGSPLHRFMDKFYINCAADELDTLQVEALCRARALNPSSFSGVNSLVRKVFREFIKTTKPTNILEVGAGTNPLISECDLVDAQINYVRSDADPINAEEKNVFSGTSNILNYPGDYFDVTAAVFVLHFKFYDEQISEIYRCLKQNGVFLANVYRRSEQSRMALQDELRRRGFELVILDDPSNLCQNHQYWVAGKNRAGAEAAAKLLLRIISAP
jgi:SAM-dependent methyltransferase